MSTWTLIRGHIILLFSKDELNYSDLLYDEKYVIN